MGLKSGYFVGSVILGLVYLLIYIKRVDLRHEMLFGGTLLLPFAFTAPFFIPEYWNPPYLLGVIPPFKIGVEDILFSFFVGGIASVIYEVLTRRKEVRMRKKQNKRNWIPYLAGIGLFLIGEYLFPSWSIVTLSLVGLGAGLYMVMKRRDLLIQACMAGVLFTIFYFVFFKFFGTLYPTYIESIYQHSNLLGMYVSDIPLEELMFAFSVGVGWSIGYEYILGYKTVRAGDGKTLVNPSP